MTKGKAKAIQPGDKVRLLVGAAQDIGSAEDWTDTRDMAEAHEDVNGGAKLHGQRWW